MKRMMTIALVLGISIALAARTEQQYYGVHHNVYQFLPEKDTPAPKGYEPAYISHYGRHGSRTDDTDNRNFALLAETLSKASEKGILTPQGDSVYRVALRMDEVFEGHRGSLTRRGVEEQRELARRMYSRYRNVFTKGSKFLRVETSTIARCAVSMASFLSSLTALQGDLQYSIEAGDASDFYIKKAFTRDLQARVMAHCRTYNNAIEEDTVKILTTLFTDPVAAREICGNVRKLQSRIFSTACLAKASGVETDMLKYLPDDVLRKWWSFRVRSVYMRNGNSVEYGEERMENVKPLVSAIFTHANDALSSGKVAADLKFGHDYPLVGLVAWFGLEGVGDRLSIKDLPDKWADPMNIPFASNLVIVVYRKKNAPDLVKFVYNGRERKLGRLESVSGPYYDWEAVKGAYMPKEAK